MRKQLRAEPSSDIDGQGREDRVELVDPETGKTVCRLAFRDAVVLAFEIEQAAARLRARKRARDILRRDQKP